jgi:sugar/nucleoside kinase (ribokinase family)
VRYPFHGIRGTTSGVGANLALGLRSLGHEVRLLTLLGADQPGQTALAELAAAGVDTRGVLVELAATPQSVILVDPTGQRAIMVDLKDVQEQR